jgi:Xaa-Pro aminopeptidase
MKSRVESNSRSSWLSLFGFLFIGYSIYALVPHTKDRLQCPFPAPTANPVQANRAQLATKLPSGLILLESAPKFERLGSDMELPGWRQTSNVLYILGKFDIARSFVLINSTCASLCVSVFLPELSDREIIFNGAEVDKEQVQRDFELSSVHDLQDLPAIVQGQTVYSTSPNTAGYLPKRIQTALEAHKVTIQYSVQAEQAFLQSRFIKTLPELELLHYASQSAMFTHNMVKRYIETSSVVTESQTAKYFEYVSSICGSYLQSYNPIVGSGKHSGVLHFPTGETIDSGMSSISKQDFILIDAAGAYKGYASDITRTYARRSSHKLRELSSIVFNSQQAGIAAHKLGNMVCSLDVVVSRGEC